LRIKALVVVVVVPIEDFKWDNRCM
jgi:hypothetical protein